MTINKTVNRLIFILSLVGLAVTAFLAYEYIQSGPIVCPITGSGCDLVRNSTFSKLFGIDLPYFGIAFYLTTAFISVWLTHTYHRVIDLLRLLASFSAVMFGVYLTFLEAFVIKAYCIWCIISFIVSVIIFGLCMLEFFKTPKTTPKADE